MNKVGTTIAGNFISLAEVRAREFTKEVIPPDSYINMLNQICPEVLIMLGIEDEYSEIKELTAATLKTDGILLGTANTNSYVDSTRILTCVSKEISAYYDSQGGFIDLPATVGARVIIVKNIGNDFPTFGMAYVQEVIDETHLLLDRSLGFNVTGSEFQSAAQCLIKCIGDDATLNIGIYPWYSGIKRIKNVISSVQGDVPLYTNYADFLGKSVNYQFRNRIIACKQGEIIYFAKQNVPSYGTRSALIVRKHIPIDTATDLLDMPVETEPTIMDRLLTDIVKTLNIPFPDVLKPAAARLKNLQAEAERRMQEALQNQ